MAALEARYNELKAKAEALLSGGDLKEEHQEVTTTEEIPYPSRTENNADLAEGTRKVKQAGEKGQKKVVWDVTLVNGVEKKRDRKSQTVIKEPVEEIIEVGTKKFLMNLVVDLLQPYHLSRHKREISLPISQPT